jgi:serine/threonine protein kinase
MLPVVRALVCAHEAGIVHRDLKPSDVMLARIDVLGFLLVVAELVLVDGGDVPVSDDAAEAIDVPVGSPHERVQAMSQRDLGGLSRDGILEPGRDARADLLREILERLGECRILEALEELTGERRLGSSGSIRLAGEGRFDDERLRATYRTRRVRRIIDERRRADALLNHRGGGR